MKDRIGQEVEIGDKVLVNAKGYRNMVIATVVKITPKKLVLEYKSFGSNSILKYTVEPIQCVKPDPEALTAFILAGGK